MKSEMEELFADLCQVPRLVARRAGFRPALDVYRTDDPPAVTVVVELAGIDPDEVDKCIERAYDRLAPSLSLTRVNQEFQSALAEARRRICQNGSEGSCQLADLTQDVTH